MVLAELNKFSNLGKGPEAMKVPYTKKWQKETDKLRQIALDRDLTQELKWGKPCFTFRNKNVAIVIPLRESCAFSFFKGTLLKDPKHLLQRIGQMQAGRWIKFTSIGEIAAVRSTLKDYLYEAIELEKSGKRVVLHGETDEELALDLGVSLSAVKKTWAHIYERTSAYLPDVCPACEPSGAAERGKEKKQRLLSYLRDHPEELRPASPFEL